MFGRIARTLRPAWRRLAAAGAAAALAAGSLLSPPPAAADYAFPLQVTYDNVFFNRVNDGVDCTVGFPPCLKADMRLEVYGTVAAYTSAGASGAGGLPYLNLDDEPVETGTYYFSKFTMCASSTKFWCAGNTVDSTNNNTIPLWVRPNEQIIVAVEMWDRDAGSANDKVCVGNLKFGPYTTAELIAKKYLADSQGKKITMPDNGEAECDVAFHLS